MRVDATIRVPGAVIRLGTTEAVPPEGVAIDPRSTLWIDGQKLGHVLNVTPQGHREYVAGDPTPVAFVVSETVIDCVLEVP